MDDLNSYLHEELSKIPFSIFDLFCDYINLNKNVKIAIVGGYIRDLIIKKYHRKTQFKIIDLDIIVEGSAISLAKFIKKKILKVDFCLIKEFKLYNTVEMNINNITIDIASAREEVYTAPGQNPKVKDSNIKNDLKRRDFSINAIAYEISKKELIDLFEGIKHIKKKELHLLHKNSIKDDPSRLLRCAKYASRLNFQISQQSLIQSQKFIQEWPWKYEKNDFGVKFPPGISIRIRMEISEILKHDNLTFVISKLDEWEVIALLNNKIKVNKKFLRGLRWIQRLNGKTILYLLKDSNSFDLICERFFINKKDRKILYDFQKTKKLLNSNNKFDNYSPSNWTKFIEESNLDPETVKLIISDDTKFWKPLLRWLLIYRFIKSNKDGEELKKEGWLPGKIMGDEIKRLRYIQIDKHLKR
tara:strand:- start:1376 stop:2620 length:1245 start_codon:yes stop_codon:yes gene_type:complete